MQAMSDQLPPGLAKAWAPRRESKQGLSAERIVQAAIELADADGLAAVSMARVAQRLGFTTMSLYRHVANKDELLVLMLGAAMEMPPARPYDGWRQGLEQWAWDVLGMVRAHPWVVYVRISPPPATPSSVTLMERGLSPLAGTPLSEDEKANLLLVVNGYVFWQARLEVELGPGTGDAADDALVAWYTVMHTLVDERWPAVRRVVDAGVFDNEDDTRDADFAFGLGLLLGGLEARFTR
jgi:AcrR family transcriptional regulator